ncbi:MAG: hypothetical protein EON61_04145 [Alphaproteobacteria bacterium]|nr:MAG: hypothetical protein EON61_04145 [Alphaproteobacteria bacterium]
MKTAPRGFAANIEASHRAVEVLLEYLAKLQMTPNGVMQEAEKHASAWRAVKQAAAVLRQTEDKLRAEAKSLAEELEAETKAYWQSVFPSSQAFVARVYDVAQSMIEKGDIENLRAMMLDPQVSAVIALSPRELVSPRFVPSVREGLVRGELYRAQPDLKAKSNLAADMMDLADGHKAVWRDVTYGVTSEKAAEAYTSRPADPVIEAAPAL